MDDEVDCASDHCMCSGSGEIDVTVIEQYGCVPCPDCVSRELSADARRYRYLRGRDLDAITVGGVFAGRVPQNLVVNGDDLDRAIDAAMAVSSQADAAE